MLVASLGFASPAPLAVPKDKKADDVKKKLATKITLDRNTEKNTPLRDMIEFLGGRVDLKILIDNRAFEAAGIKNVHETPVKFPKQNNVPLAKILQKVLDQIEGVKATYRIEKDHILIVPDKMKK